MTEGLRELKPLLLKATCHIFETDLHAAGCGRVADCRNNLVPSFEKLLDKLKTDAPASTNNHPRRRHLASAHIQDTVVEESRGRRL